MQSSDVNDTPHPPFTLCSCPPSIILLHIPRNLHNAETLRERGEEDGSWTGPRAPQVRHSLARQASGVRGASSNKSGVWALSWEHG